VVFLRIRATIGDGHRQTLPRRRTGKCQFPHGHVILDTAAALVLNGGIDSKMFLDANTEHVFIYAKIADFLREIRELFREPDFLIHLENLVKSMPDFEAKMESRKRLIAIWTKKGPEASAA
jgi:hypothetical protein